MKSFLSRLGSLVRFVLSGFDRLRLRGDSRLLNHAGGVESYVYQFKIPYKDFAKHCSGLTASLRRDTEALALQQDLPLCPLNSPKIDKEATALELARLQQRTSGPIAILSCVEACQTYVVRKNAEGLGVLRKEQRRCSHYYHYFLHERFGLCYVRLQTWFPFTVQVGLNGRHWLGRQLQQRGVPFQSKRNLILDVADPALAQALLDEQRRTCWPAVLQELVQPIQPLWTYLHETVRTPYYWMTEQSEWATDYIFRSPEDLALWYPRWLRHGIDTLRCQDVLRYLGKKATAACTGETKIDLRTRHEGTRLKFWYDSNSIKIYDKEATALRIETTLNNPRGFKVFRTKEGETEDAPPSWQQMRKGVADLDRRAEVSQAANNRLAESLASVAETTPLGKLLEPLCRPVLGPSGRRVRALNPSAGPDGELLRCLAQGEFLINGFRNRDLRVALHGTPADKQEQRRQGAAITRKLALLRSHGLIVKVQKTHRYQLSADGKRIIAALSAAYAADINGLAPAA